jgi:C-terminal processing protease CtpA/Prc
MLQHVRQLRVSFALCMGTRRSFAVAVTIMLGSLIASGQLRAQAATPTSRERGCRGDEMTFDLDGVFLTMTAFPVISIVPSGTPAALAGLQVGDSVVSVAGRDSRERPKGERPFFAPGDSLALVVRRQQVDIPIVIVFGRLLQEGTGSAATRLCRPVRSETPI